MDSEVRVMSASFATRSPVWVHKVATSKCIGRTVRYPDASHTLATYIVATIGTTVVVPVSLGGGEFLALVLSNAVATELLICLAPLESTSPAV